MLIFIALSSLSVIFLADSFDVTSLIVVCRVVCRQVDSITHRLHHRLVVAAATCWRNYHFCCSHAKLIVIFFLRHLCWCRRSHCWCCHTPHEVVDCHVFCLHSSLLFRQTLICHHRRQHHHSSSSSSLLLLSPIHAATHIIVDCCVFICLYH